VLNEKKYKSLLMKYEHELKIKKLEERVLELEKA